MNKLFSLEAIEEEKPGELLIDKLTNMNKTKKEGLSVTADLIKERNQLKSELDKEFQKKQDEPSAKEGEGGGSASEDNSDADKDESKSEDNKPSGDGDSGDGGGSDGGDSTGAEDLDNLNSLVGSAKGGEPATESFRNKSTRAINISSLKSLFAPISQRYNEYCVSLESMNLSDQKKPPQEQPVAYVKEEVLKSLNGLINLAGRYVTNNESGITESSEGIKRLSEQLTVYEQYHGNEKLHFTSKLVSKDDIKTSLSVNEKSDIRETSAILAKYLESTVPLIDKLLTNPLEQFPSVLQTSGFAEQADSIDYKTILPGFYKVCAAFTPFTNYLETDYENYQIYRLKTFKLQDLYKLDHIALTEDKDFVAIMAKASSVVMSVGLCIDNLKTINDSYKNFIDKLKATVYEIEKGEKEKLADLDLDGKMKDFIKYKLVAELYTLNISMGIEFLTSLMSAFTILADIGE